ncbi:anti-sigma factor family protein [Nocardiopsis changdeensis]|uniref:anti-sigma factor family protein n=1 Tax=Nocardiopsis changdeensis TaxID=2831969 RepID=UPI003F47B38A
MTSHPDVEALAFFAEELLEPDEERTVAHHLETCAICAATLDELAAVGGALADAPPVPPMPQDVAALLDRRIDEAVRERAARPAALSGTSGDAGTGPADAAAPVVPITRARGGSRRGFNGMNLPRLMMVAAAGAVVLGGGGAVLNTVLSSQQDASGGAAAQQPMMQDEGAEFEPEAVQPYKPGIVATGTEYTADGLAGQAAEVLSGSQAPPATAEEGSTVAAEECATVFSERTGVRITLVDEAVFDGDPAMVLFAPSEDDTTEVYVVDPADCGGVLAQETVDTP